MNQSAKRIMAELMTNKKRPSVRKVTGIVNTTRTGRIVALRRARINATKNAVKKPST